MSHDNVNGKVNGELIYQRKIEEVIKTLVHEEGVTNDAAVLGRMVWNAVRAMSAVDAAPVVHGRWELHGNDDDCGSSYSCTNCGSGYDEDCFYDHGQYVPYLFCPNCGAKMDLEEQHEQTKDSQTAEGTAENVYGE